MNRRIMIQRNFLIVLIVLSMMTCTPEDNPTRPRDIIPSDSVGTTPLILWSWTGISFSGIGPEPTIALGLIQTQW